MTLNREPGGDDDDEDAVTEGTDVFDWWGVVLNTNDKRGMKDWYVSDTLILLSSQYGTPQW